MLKPLARLFGCAVFLASLVQAEELVTYKLNQNNGRTLIQSSSGEIIHWAGYSHGNDRSAADWLKRMPAFTEAGVNLYQLATWPWPFGGDYFENRFWSNDDAPFEPGPEVNEITARIEGLIKLNPNARFIIRLSPVPGRKWRDAHPELFAPVDGLPPEKSKRLAQGAPSLASDEYVKGVDLLVRNVIRWFEARPYRNRIVGYTVFPLGEGSTELSLNGYLFDSTACMQKAFAAFVKDKYANDGALQKSWNDLNVKLSDIRVPTEPEWREKRASLMHWPEPRQTQRERDYFELQEKLFARYFNTIVSALAEATASRPVVKGCDMLKQPMQGWMHTPEFDGNWERGANDSYGSIMLAGGTLNATKLLDHRGFDTLQTPGMYYNRALGFAWEAEGLTDSLTLRGKMNYIEADLRTWVSKTRDGNPDPANPINEAGVLQNLEQLKAGFDRALAMAVSRNQAYYYHTVSARNWWFDDPEISKYVSKQRQAIERLAKIPWKETQHAICLVIDEDAAKWEDFTSGFQHAAVFRQIQEGLALSGVPYRIHLLQDLDRDNFPAYKVYLFPNLFRVDGSVNSLLRKRVLRDGNVAIFGPGTGITDGIKRSADGASQVLGVPMKLVEKSCPRRVLITGGHPISDRMPTMTFGEDYAYGPLLVPAEPNLKSPNSAHVLGSGWFYYGIDRPGLFINEFGLGAAGNAQPGIRGVNDYAVVFSSAVPLPPELLRECARYAGCNIWLEQNAVVYACDNFAALHTVKPGKHSLHLPGNYKVKDFYTGELLHENTNVVEMEIKAPATRMFILEK